MKYYPMVALMIGMMLIAGCGGAGSTDKPAVTAPGVSGSGGDVGSSESVPALPPAGTEDVVADEDIAEVDELDQDLDTDELENLDDDLADLTW